MSEAEKRLHVANLPSDITEEEIRHAFGTYGDVQEVSVNHRSAFVGFSDAREALAAMLVLGDMYKFREDAPDPLRISVAPPGQRGDKWNDGGWHRGTPTPADSQLALPPAPTGDAVPASATPPPRMGAPPPPAPPPPPPGAQGGYAGGGSGDGGGSYTGQHENGTSGPPSTSQPTKLWVGNLPGDVSQDEVQSVFSAYGRLTEVNVLPVKSRTGQACAFVHYESKDNADRCLEAMKSGYQFRTGDSTIIRVEIPGSEKGKGKKGDSKGFAPPPPPGDRWGGGGGDRWSDQGGGGRYRPY